MIEKVRIENFKGIKKAELELGDVTVLIGPNGTGKSSIIQALMVLRQSIGQMQLRTSGELIELGQYNDIVNVDAKEKNVGIGVSVKLKEYKAVNIPNDSTFSCDSYWNPNIYKFDARVGNSDEEYVNCFWSTDKGISSTKDKVMPVNPVRDLWLSINLRQEFYQPLGVGGDNIPKDLESIDDIKEMVSKLREEANDIVRALPDNLKNIYYVPAIRGIEKRTYALATEYKVDVPAGSNTQLATTFAYTGNQIKEMIEIWSRDITGSGIEVNVVPNRQVLIASSAAGGIPVIIDGSGVNQLVQLLLMFATVPSGSTLGIDEPEIHLHPKAQEKLSGLLVDLIQEVWRRQLIITTHSQNILFGFLKKVKNGDMERDKLKIYYFESKDKEPEKIEIDEGGDIYEWGNKFFA